MGSSSNAPGNGCLFDPLVWYVADAVMYGYGYGYGNGDDYGYALPRSPGNAQGAGNNVWTGVFYHRGNGGRTYFWSNGSDCGYSHSAEGNGTGVGSCGEPKLAYHF